MHKRVFLIDDDDVNLMICEIRLKKSNFCEEVITAENGEDAINYLNAQFDLPESERKLPDLIFLDLNMPVMDGWEFLEEYGKNLATKLNHVPIFILTSTVDPEDAERASFEPLVMGFVNKPLTDLSLKKLENSRILTEEHQIII
ncbi:MAG: response regulator [Bacteroidia bacterium]|nr:response regulator [Bacteroidia bacterium]MCF8425317.1 response regulator [Bacteroidia bacterium]MCF8446106.1 response regulator [Bacteroidia bacterium]